MELHLSGEKLKLALESLVTHADEHGGVETYVAAVRLKSQVFRDALDAGLDLKAFRTLCAHMATVRRRIGVHAEPEGFARLRPGIDALVSSGDLAAFCARFPEDRDHRWVRDLAAELLHHADPERYPLMTRWVWDARTNTGVLREIWHAENVDSITIEVPDTYDAFVKLREELAQYLTANGVYRDVLFFVGVLQAQVYADYIGERGGTYLRTDFATPEDPMLHARRILGLDGISPSGRTKLRSPDGRAEVVQ
jgi:hypothetical protein